MTAARQSQTMEAQMQALDLARSLHMPRAPMAPVGGGDKRVSLHAEAELRLARRQNERRRVIARECAARNAPKVDPQSDLLSRERLWRDCQKILEAWGMVDGGGMVQYESFLRSVDKVVDFTLVSEDLHDLSLEEKEILCERIWACLLDRIDDATGEGHLGHPDVTGNAFLHAVINVQYGESLNMEKSSQGLSGLETESKEIDEAAVGVFDEFVRVLARTKLSIQPVHTNFQTVGNLEKRLQSLNTVALQYFTDLMKKCGLKLNYQERDVLFECFDLERQRSLDLSQFSKEVNCILSPRRNAIVKTLKSFSASNVSFSTIAIADLIKRAESLNPSRMGLHGNKLEETLNMIAGIRERLQDSLRRLGGDINDQAGNGSYSKTATSHTKARSESLQAEISSSESSVAPDTFQMNPLESLEVQARMVKKSQGRQQGKNLDLGDNLPRHIYLHQLQQKWLENQFVARQLQDEKEMEHCTFRPQINVSEAKKTRDGSICDRLYELARSQGTVSKELSWEARELRECTFKPAINSQRMPSTPSKTADSASEKKHIQRVRQTLIGTQVGNVPESADSQSSGGHRPKPKASESKDPYQMEVMPLVLMEINLRDGKIARIPVFKGNEPEALAKSFCQAHNLGASSETKLAQMIADQIVGL